MKSKKAVSSSIELSVIIFGLIFMTFLNISLGFVLDSSLVSNYDPEATISEYVNNELDLGIVLGSAVTGLLWLINIFFSIFGVNFVGVITILPLWVGSIFLLLNTLISFSIIMYFVDRIWIG